jgi:hypothetical protein
MTKFKMIMIALSPVGVALVLAVDVINKVDHRNWMEKKFPSFGR